MINILQCTILKLYLNKGKNKHPEPFVHLLIETTFGYINLTYTFAEIKG
ncbi:MAG: hypothetical protein NVSMB45_15250 [Ginsengibacter sp.]